MKRIAAFFSVLMILSVLMTLVVSVKAPNGTLFKWTSPAYVGPDMFYDPSYPYDSVTGYLENTEWNFTMNWTNAFSYFVNVSAIRIYFDWGKNYTHRFAEPVQIMPGDPEIFQVSNMTPTGTEAPEMWTHSYHVYIDEVNDTSPPYEDLSPLSVYWGDDFAVLSTDHLECLRILMKFGAFTSEALGGAFRILTDMPNVAETQVLLTRMLTKLQQGVQYYQMGSFGPAKSYLQDMDAFFTNALDAWNSTGKAMEEAGIGLSNAETNHYNALANSASVNAYGWLFFGLGWVFIGIGIIIYGARKAKTT